MINKTLLLIFYYLFISTSLSSCIGAQEKAASQQPINLPYIIDSFKKTIDTAGMSQSNRLKALIAVTILNEIAETRNRISDEGKEYNYNVSEVNRSGNSYNFNVSIPESSIESKVTFNPFGGEYTKYWVGEKSEIQTMYNQVKMQNIWKNCNQEPEGEICTTQTDDPVYPIEMHFRLSLSIVNENTSTIMLTRLMRPK
jgi:hypothetical protein